jgi:hypothetical protein
LWTVSGTSLNEDKSIDKADIYSTEETGTRRLDRAQEKPVEKVEDKEKGSWRIKEEGEEEQRWFTGNYLNQYKTNEKPAIIYAFNMKHHYHFSD